MGDNKKKVRKNKIDLEKIASVFFSLSCCALLFAIVFFFIYVVSILALIKSYWEF